MQFESPCFAFYFFNMYIFNACVRHPLASLGATLFVLDIKIVATIVMTVMLYSCYVISVYDK